MVFNKTLKGRALKVPNSSFLSDRAMAIKPSLTLEITAKAKALKSQGKDICNLSAGEPDFDTPNFILEATIEALRKGITRYGPAAGDPELREAIANKLKNINNIPSSLENVIVTNGGKQAIYNLFQVILNPGDEVIIPSPYWLSYPDIALMAGAKPVIVNSSPSNAFKINIENLEANVSQNTRLLILNSPNNPSGLVMKKEEMENIANFLRSHPNILLLSDEIYEFILGEGQKHFSFAAIAPDLIDRVFTVNGFAKGWAMTGWRIGYLAGHSEVIKKASALQSQSTSNVCSFAQRGALAALQGSKACIKQMNESYNTRRNLLIQGLERIKGISITKPEGAFYAFPKIELNHLNSIDFCNMALDKVGLSVIPGIAFGEDSCFRISCSVSTKTLTDGLNRLDQLTSKL